MCIRDRVEESESGHSKAEQTGSELLVSVPGKRESNTRGWRLDRQGWELNTRGGSSKPEERSALEEPGSLVSDLQELEVPNSQQLNGLLPDWRHEYVVPRLYPMVLRRERILLLE